MFDTNLFIGPPPCTSGDIIKVGNDFYKVISIEPLYYPYEASPYFVTGNIPLTPLIPSPSWLYFINTLVIDAKIQLYLNYPSNDPRLTPNSAAHVELDRFVASFEKPFMVRAIFMQGDTPEIVVTPKSLTPKGKVWFFGWKIREKAISPPPEGTCIVEIDEYRSRI